MEFVDGSVKAQIAPPDMRIPIQYALTYPARKASSFPKVDLVTQSWGGFERPDMEKFPALEYAYRAGKIGGDDARLFEWPPTRWWWIIF